MNENNLTFKIDNSNLIEIKASKSLSDLFRYNQISIIAHGKSSCHVLFTDFAIMGLRNLQEILEKAISTNLYLDESINKNIGYHWNKYLNGDNRQLKYVYGREGQRFWVGERYLLWSASLTTSWLYNKAGKFYFEITPTYPWHFTDRRKAKKEDPNYYTYREFMRNYQPHVKVELSRETVEQWYKQATELLAQVEANDAKYQDVLDAMPKFVLRNQGDESS